MFNRFLHSNFALSVVLCSCVSTDQRWHVPANAHSGTPLAMNTGAAQRTPLTEEQGCKLAYQCWDRFFLGTGCGGLRLENETSTTWYYRIYQGYAGEKRGLISVDKRNGVAVPVGSYPGEIH